MEDTYDDLVLADLRVQGAPRRLNAGKRSFRATIDDIEDREVAYYAEDPEDRENDYYKVINAPVDFGDGQVMWFRVDMSPEAVVDPMISVRAIPLTNRALTGAEIVVAGRKIARVLQDLGVLRLAANPYNMAFWRNPDVTRTDRAERVRPSHFRATTTTADGNFLTTAYMVSIANLDGYGAASIKWLEELPEEANGSDSEVKDVVDGAITTDSWGAGRMDSIVFDYVFKPMRSGCTPVDRLGLLDAKQRKPKTQDKNWNFRLDMAADTQNRCRVLSLMLAPVFTYHPPLTEAEATLTTPTNCQIIGYDSDPSQLKFKKYSMAERQAFTTARNRLQKLVQGGVDSARRVMDFMVALPYYQRLMGLNGQEENFDDRIFFQKVGELLRIKIALFPDDGATSALIIGDLGSQRVVYLGRRETHIYSVIDPRFEVHWRQMRNGGDGRLGWPTTHGNPNWPCAQGACKAEYVPVAADHSARVTCPRCSAHNGRAQTHRIRVTYHDNKADSAGWMENKTVLPRQRCIRFGDAEGIEFLDDVVVALKDMLVQQTPDSELDRCELNVYAYAEVDAQRAAREAGIVVYAVEHMTEYEPSGKLQLLTPQRLRRMEARTLAQIQAAGGFDAAENDEGLTDSYAVLWHLLRKGDSLVEARDGCMEMPTREPSINHFFTKLKEARNWCVACHGEAVDACVGRHEIIADATHECKSCKEAWRVTPELSRCDWISERAVLSDHVCRINTPRISISAPEEPEEEEEGRRRRPKKPKKPTVLYLYDIETIADPDATNSRERGMQIPVIVHVQKVDLRDKDSINELYARSSKGSATEDDMRNWMRQQEVDGVEFPKTFTGRNCMQEFMVHMLRYASAEGGYVCAFNGGSFDHQFAVREAFMLQSQCDALGLTDAEKERVKLDIEIPRTVGESIAHFISWTWANLVFKDPMCMVGGSSLKDFIKAGGAHGAIQKIDVDISGISMETVVNYVEYCKRDVTVLKIAFLRYLKNMEDTIRRLKPDIEIDLLQYNTAASLSYDLFVFAARQSGFVMRQSRPHLAVLGSARELFERHPLLRPLYGGPLGALHTWARDGDRVYVPIDHYALNCLRRSTRPLERALEASLERRPTEEPACTSRWDQSKKDASDFMAHRFNAWVVRNELQNCRIEYFTDDLDPSRVRAITNPRDAYFGGRTEALKMVKVCAPGEHLRMDDIKSSYPTQYSTKKLPFGASRWVPGSEFNHDLESLKARIRGGAIMILTVDVQLPPPERCRPETFFPVLGVRVGDKLCFPAQAVCPDMAAETEVRRVWTATYTSEDLRLALQEGYDIVRVHDGFVWDENQCAVGLCGRFCEVFFWVKENCPDLKACTKILLNSCYGKLALRPTTSISMFCNTNDAMKECLEKAYELPIQIDKMRVIRMPQACATLRKFPLARTNEMPGTSVACGAFVTSYARSHLSEGVISIRDACLARGELDPMARVCYMDTDSILYTCPDDVEGFIPHGSELGDWEDEIGVRDDCTLFACPAPKTYFIGRGSTQAPSVKKIRCKGVRPARTGESAFFYAAPPIDTVNKRGRRPEETAEPLYYYKTDPAPSDGFFIGREFMSNSEVAALWLREISRIRGEVLELDPDSGRVPNWEFAGEMASMAFTGTLCKSVDYVEKRQSISHGKRRIVLDINDEWRIDLYAYGAHPTDAGPKPGSHAAWEQRILARRGDEFVMTEFHVPGDARAPAPPEDPNFQYDYDGEY